MDEVGTPDSSRIWDGPAYREGRVVENSKEQFRQLLLQHFSDPDILTNKSRMAERPALAQAGLPLEILIQTSETYRTLAQRITGEPLELSDNPRAEIIDTLAAEFGLVD
jgi:phosphoribosylaminoimidazole-succinocarboxamide synthase